MSQNEEQKHPTQEQEAKHDAATESVDEVQIVDAMKPSSAPSIQKPLRYGTRKKRAGAEAPAVTKISSISTFEEEEIEMDDLPIRANAPEHLIDSRSNPSERREEDSERRPRRNDRPRGERQGEPRRRRSSEPQEETPERQETEASAEVAPQESETPRSDRPERFGVVENKGRSPSAPPVQEFRPSRDGKTAAESEKGKRSGRSPRAQPKKKGILSKILAFFTGGDKEEEKKPAERRPSGRGPGGERRGPSNRQRPDGGDGSEGGERRRKRRPRNRKPRGDRPEGEEGSRQNREGGNREGGNRRRGRRPRREGGPGNRNAERSSTE